MSSIDPGPPARPDDSAAAPVSWAQAAALFRRLGPAGPLALIAASMPAVVGLTIFGLLPVLGGWLRVHPVWGPVLYTGLYIVFGGLGFLPTYAYSALAGYAFGFHSGVVLAMASYAGASLVGYLVARRAAGGRVLAMIGEHAKWKAVYEALLGSGLPRALLIVTLLRVSSSPFALTNLIMAATRVQLTAYIVGTIAGLAPRTGAVVFLASRFGLQEREPSWLWGLWIGVTLLILGIIGHMANQAVARVTAAEGSSESVAELQNPASGPR